MAKDLIILESPNKVKTFYQILGTKNYVIMASVGHDTKIADTGKYHLGIDLETFEANYIIDPSKRDIVKKLQAEKDIILKSGGKIILYTDPDREGEAISFHLKNILKLSDKDYVRCTVNEITKTAIEHALNNPRKLDDNMVSSAESRAELDKIIGYLLSNNVHKKVGARSAGRVQSAALKILCDREREILSFIPKKYYEIYLPFIKNKVEYKAKFKGEVTKNYSTIEDKSIAENIVKSCKSGNYQVCDISTKERNISSKLPFTTSTFQQACSSLLGYSPSTAMSCAQKLFEGIDLGNNHVALITYIRTDSTVMAEEFKETLKDYVIDNFGKEYYSPVKQGKKKKSEQDGHECLRVIDLNMTPEKLSSKITDSQLLKVYTLIYKRTLSSSMSDSTVIDTKYSIKNDKYLFDYTAHKIKFDGFKKVWNYSEKDEDDSKDPKLSINEFVKDKPLELLEKETTPPGRYSEASLIKTLEDLGIGRPSTFASIVTILKDNTRGYVEMVGKSMKPTELGMKLSEYLDKYFGDFINLKYTAELEEDLDKVANGELTKYSLLSESYNKFSQILAVANSIESNTENITKYICPLCGGHLIKRRSKYGEFYACENYRAKKCKYTAKISEDGSPEEIIKKTGKDTSEKCDCGGNLIEYTSQKGTVYRKCEKCGSMYFQDVNGIWNKWIPKNSKVKGKSSRKITGNTKNKKSTRNTKKSRK